MDVTWTVKYITEFLGTALLIILGNGAVANVELKGTKGHQTGWLLIALGYGFGVMMPALMFGNVSGNHINPAFTLGLAVSGYFPWTQVPYYIIAQFLGAIAGQLIVVGVHRQYYHMTTESNAILGTFSTIVAVDSGDRACRKRSLINGFTNEFWGSFVLFFSAMALTRHYFGAEVAEYATKTAGIDVTNITGKLQVGMFTTAGQGIAHLALGFLVMALVAAFGGPTGPALNPARDLGPRFLHWLLPTSVLGPNKSDSKWWYSWVPVVAPILAGILAVATYKLIYG